MKRFALLLIILFVHTSINSQDTITVQAFNYDSNTRDSLIYFPEGDHNEYRQIIMSYNMRCKDALVSTTSDRNKGCGEWDYSCNTSIIDSTLVDSLQATHPDNIIVGFSGDQFNYSTSPVYEYQEKTFQNIRLVGFNNEVKDTIGDDVITDESIFANQNNQKAYYLIKKDQLDIENIGGMSFDNLSIEDDISFFKIGIAHTSEETLNHNTISQVEFETVFYNNVSKETLKDETIVFSKDFDLDNQNNILLEITYSSSERTTLSNANTSINSNMNVMLHSGDEKYCQFNNDQLDVPIDNLQDIENEITIAMWVRGDEKLLPKATTLLSGRDNDENRTVNIHLPWSNGQVYWDCGNEGSSYDRINKTASPEDYRGKWNHWAFTKNAVTGDMSIYLNGQMWHNAGNRFNTIDINDLRIGSNFNNGSVYFGDVDDIMIFDKALSSEEIISISRMRVTSSSELYEHLKMFLDFNDVMDNKVIDKSLNGIEATFSKTPRILETKGENIFKDFSFPSQSPNIILHSANFIRVVNLETVLDSTYIFPYEVQSFHVQGTDLIQDPSIFLWEAGFTPIFDENGNLIDSIAVDTEGTVEIGQLDYYSKNPAKYELLSFVTPYGINLDFGENGRTWSFDVTDFGPILKGNRRLVMDRGGQWQEEMDIKFHFIKGKPIRDVFHIHQIWPVQSRSNSNILQDNSFEPRTIPIEDDIHSAKLRMAITGHGQEGEFIPRSHYVNLNGDIPEFNWRVWKECAFNPIYPQGGTWVYDRAGWCPGEPTELVEHEIMGFVGSNDNVTIDYGMETATGNSNYIVSGQLVKYGPPNFQIDASLESIISPSSYVEYERINPSCANPTILIRNTGQLPITSMTIDYGVVGTDVNTYEWNGNLAFLEYEEITLPSFPQGRWSGGSSFEAKIVNVNGVLDDYADNDAKTSDFTISPHINGSLIVNLNTNGAPNETQWFLRDDSGSVVAQRTLPLTSFTNYTDTISNLNGCYSLQFVDSGQDGISWWANNDGNGSIRLKEEGANWITLQPDFGGEISYNFTAGLITTTNELENEKETVFRIFPNHTLGMFNIELSGFDESRIQIINSVGSVIDDRSFTNRGLLEKISYDISTYPSGIYFVHLSSKNGKRFVEKLIKH